MHKLIATSTLLVLTASTAQANTSSEIQALRQEIQVLRADYEARLQALEQRLQSAITANTSNMAATAPVTEVPQNVVTTSNAAGGAKAFNPAMSLILSGTYAHTSLAPALYRIAGMSLPENAELGLGTRGFSLAESELGFSASIDPWLKGVANIALHPDDAVSVEEAYVQTTSLGHGLSFKAGRFFSGLGYLNAQHSHAWNFVDNPLAYQALLGTQYSDDGVQLRWLAPTDLYLELGMEFGRGRGFPGSSTDRNGIRATTLTAHAGGDLSTSQNWRAGISMLNAKADELRLMATDIAGADVATVFNGRTRIWVADAVWKWAPHGNASRTHLKLQAEYLRSTRDGTLTDETNNVTDRYNVLQSGWYAQGIYQFMPRWRVGLRTERLKSGIADYGMNSATLASNGMQPHKNTAMLEFSPSEFSRVRVQLAKDRSNEGSADKQLLLQYQMSLGAHGAHTY